MKFISMFLASMRVARELDQTRFTAAPASTKALVDEISGSNLSAIVTEDDDTVDEHSVPHPA